MKVFRRPNQPGSCVAFLTSLLKLACKMIKSLLTCRNPLPIPFPPPPLPHKKHKQSRSYEPHLVTSSPSLPTQLPPRFSALTQKVSEAYRVICTTEAKKTRFRALRIDGIHDISRLSPSPHPPGVLVVPNPRKGGPFILTPTHSNVNRENRKVLRTGKNMAR